jgi:hypothetical protein
VAHAISRQAFEKIAADRGGAAGCFAHATAVSRSSTFEVLKHTSGAERGRLC